MRKSLKESTNFPFFVEIIAKHKFNLIEPLMEDLLYHYTSVESLFNILNNTENLKGIEYIKLRASFFMNMNDPNDCIYFINELSELLAKDDTEESKIKKDFKNGINVAGVPYIISLSSTADSIPMWKMYAENGHGVTIDFNKKIFAQAVKDYQNNGNNKQIAASKHCGCKLLECKYWNKADIKKYYIEAFNLNKNNIASMQKDTCETAYLIKDPSYSYEKESRVVFLLSPINEYPFFMELLVPIDAISSIKAGPCCNEDIVKAIVPDYIKGKVVKSKVSYRDSVNKIKPGPYDDENEGKIVW